MLYHLKDHRVREEELAYLVSRLATTQHDNIDPVTDGCDNDQSNFVNIACRSGISLLRGYPGTGKTTTIKRVIQSFQEAGMRGAVFCPTAKAAKRVREVLEKRDASANVDTKHLVVSTIHMGLKYKNGGFVHDENNVLPYDFVICDEMSMAGLDISNALFRAINQNDTRVVMSGDEYQLPSVDNGCVYRDIIQSKVIPSVHLSHIHRQGADSGIVHNAVRVLNGKMPISHDEETGEKYTDCNFVKFENVGMAQEWILNNACDLAPVMHRLNAERDIQVLAPGKRGELGTMKLNERLRDKLNPGGKAKFCGLKVKDKVINRSNNYDKNIVNGDVGIVVEANANGATIDFGIGAGASLDGMVDFTAESGLKIQLAYCYTVHSSQGSEFPCVVLPISSMHYTLLFRSLLYTAMTRPSKFLYVAYEGKAMNICVKNNKPLERKTRLQKFIAKYMATQNPQMAN